MTSRIPLTDADNVVVNITTIEAGTKWTPPKGQTAQPPSDTAQIGDRLVDGQYLPPIPKEATSFLARDLVALFTPADIGAIDAAADQNPQISLWRAMLYSRGEKPIDMDSETFPQAWGALTAVLGKDRADELLAKLRSK